MSNESKKQSMSDRYGIQGTSDGRYNIYSTQDKVDIADLSESSTLRKISELIKSKTKAKLDENGEMPIGEAVEVTVERLVVNAEAHATRTYQALLDPELAKFAIAA